MIEVETTTYRFLEGGGEMGQLVRSFDWSATPIGAVDEWPQSLRTMVDMLLHSEVPMLLWWGDDLIQFYNDAYRPGLGQNGKHPTALGQRGADCWPEIWDIIEPLIQRVRQGGATWSVDQLIPINRNGRIEDVYWTFGYSPVRDDSGVIAGVLVICNETTKSVTAVRKIEESERMMRSIVLHAPVGICILDGDPLRSEVVNDIFLKIVDKTREEFENQPYWSVFPELREMYGEFLESVAATGVPFRGKELKFVLNRHGVPETFYLDFIIETVKATNHSGRKVMLIAIDVTDKVLARLRLEESEQRYRMLIAESTVAIALYIGRDLRIQYVNEIMTSYWGRDMSVIGQTLPDAVPELREQSFIGKLIHVFETGVSYEGKEEEAFLLRDGKLHASYYNFIYKALRDSEGNIYGIHHMAMDVTEQVVARKKVEQDESILRNMILHAPIAMCILKGSDFVVEIANERMFQLWGKSRQEIIHRPVFQALPEARFQGFEEILASVYRKGESFSAEAVPIQLPRKDSVEQIFVNLLYEPYRDADGMIIGVMAVASEVTQQVRARQRVEELVEERTRELAESNKQLRVSNDELAQFAYIASHDLQEPARKISTFTEMLQKTLAEKDQRSHTLLQKIESSSLRMLSLIRGILTYSQLDKEEQDICAVDLNEVLETILEDFELRIEEKGAVIKSDRLPVIEGIPVQINQLFANLISNGLKFTRENKTPELIISCVIAKDEEVRSLHDLKPEKRYYKISVQDNGIGFDQRNADQIFDIFQRLHAKGQYEGTGIGLAMCKKIAQNHHGDVVAESIQGQGATFHVFLPVVNT